MDSIFDNIRRQISSRDTAPVYYLHGEEGYFIDALLKDFADFLPEHDKPFNMFTVYAGEKSPDDVMDLCRRYPMMADKLVVIVHEAQTPGGRWLNKLANYVAAPSPSTLLVIAARGENPSCAEFTKALKKGGGVNAEFPKVKEQQINAILIDFLKSHNLKYEPKALEMIREFVGTDLSRIFNEVAKVAVALGDGATVTPESVENLIGVNKDYNNFELKKAMASRDFVKAIKIAKHFTANQKKKSVGCDFCNTLRSLRFSSGGMVHARGDQNIASALGLRSTWQLTDILQCKKNYNPWQLIDIVSLIRRFDCQAKGNGSRRDAFLLQEELVMDILSSPGRRS